MGPIDTLKIMLDSLEEGVVFLDEAQRVVEVNAAAARLLGKDGHHAIAAICPSLFAARPGGHACARPDRCSSVRGRSDARKVQDIELRRDDGSEVALRLWAMLLPENDAGLHCSVIVRDRSREAALEPEVRERWRLGGLVGRSPSMQALYAQVLRAAASDASVLVTGESGVGKELVARALHDNSPRARGPFVPLDCGALPENLLESELFGHARGAFSGAAAARLGRFEAAGGGTLMLDEIGEISTSMQTKLLRVLQEREVVRLGENHPRKVDVRVVAATHRDLAAMVRRGEFREDLYYRLRVLPLHVAPLRERGDDIALLAGTMLGDLAARQGCAPLRIAREAMDALGACPWPGNVRQLFNALEYAAVQADGPIILRRHLPPEVLEARRHAPEPLAAPPGPLTRYYRSPAAPDEEHARIRRMLAETGGNRAEAARRLGMSRTTLWKRLRQSPGTLRAVRA